MKLNGKLEFGGVSKSNSPIENLVIEHLAGGASGASLPANGGASTAAEGAGRMVYNSDTSSYWFFDGTAWEEVAAAGEATLLTDADGDTLVQVEESADEDKIRIDVGDSPSGYLAQANAFVLGADGWIVDLGTSDASNDGADVTLTAGAADSTTGIRTGGDFTINAGYGGSVASGVAKGGALNLNGGNAGQETSGSGGAINITGGTGGDEGGPGGAINITGGTGGNNDDGGNVTIDAGDGAGAGGNGGAITLTAGDADGVAAQVGGDITMTAGGSIGTSDGGKVLINGGAAGETGSGGGIAITGAAGGGTGGAGGYVTLTAGDATGGGATGGTVSIAAGIGNTTGSGGTVQLDAGDGGVTGSGGSIIANAGDAASGFTSGGIELIAGNASGDYGGEIKIFGGGPFGGNIEINAGEGDDTGGNVTLQGGEGAVTDGVIIIRQQASDNAGEVRWEDNTGGQYVGLKAPGTVSSSFTLILPAADATVAEQALTSDMAGNLSFAGPYIDKEGGDTLGGTTPGTWTLSSGSTIAIASGADLTIADAPVSATDAVNKAYADSIAAGLDPKESVRVATDAALPAVTAAGAGVGKTLTADATGVVTVDGEDLTAANGFNTGDRILVKNQATASDNGIYTITTLSAVGVALVLTRATDQDGSPSNEVSGGNFTFVEEGTTNQDTGWVVVSDGTIDVDNGSPLPDIDWSQFTGAGSVFTAGAGIGQSGSTIYLDTLELSTITAAAIADHLVLNDDTVTPSGPDSGDRRITVANFLNTLDVVYNASGFGGNGLITRTGADTYTNRTIGVSGVGNEDGLTITNGDGASGNPTLGLDITGNATAGEDVASGDLFLLYNTSAGANEVFTGTEVASGLGGLLRLEDLADVTADTTGSPEDAGGNVLAYDTSTNKYESQAIQYIESFTSSTSFTVTHNLGQKWCNVTVTSPTGSPATDEVIIPDSIAFDSANQLTVEVSPATAVTIIVMGVPGVAVN